MKTKMLCSMYVCMYVCMLMGTILGVVKNSDAVESKKPIGVDTTWTKAESPYIINDSLYVLSGVTLTIEPGVVVKFDKDKALDVYGTLIAKGTPNEKITFTRNTFDNWGYIFFGDSSIDAVYDTYGDYTGGSILEYCIIEYAGGSNVNSNGAVRLENAHPFINYCTIQNNSASGISGWNLSSTLTIISTSITNNTATNTNGGGINISSGGTTSILNCTISKNTSSIINGYSGGGIYISSSGTTTILNNTIDSNISANGGGIYIYQQSYNGLANISNNIISNNTSSQGGGIFTYTNPGTSNFSSNIIYNNTAYAQGGGIWSYDYSSGCNTNISNNVIGNNTSSDLDGGVYAYYNAYWGDGILKVSYNNIIGNIAKNVPSIYWNNDRGYSEDKDIKYNTITNNKATDDNSYAVWIGNKPPVFNYNNIFGNTATYELWYGNPKGSYDMLDAKNNWWGTSNEDEIADKIHDFGDDASYDIVNYFNYDTAIRTDAPISPPSGLTATPGNGQISLSWNANPESDAAGYKVYWNTTSGFPYTNSADAGNQTNYTITGLSAGKYYVTVTAYDNQYTAENDDPNTIVNDNQTNGNESWFADEKTTTVTSTSHEPHINSLSSFLGSSGDTVTITGLNFGDTQGLGVVNFGNTTANVTSWSDTSIVATVPQLTPETYDLSVTTNGHTSNATSFLVTEPPSEGDFSIKILPNSQTVFKRSSIKYSVFIKPTKGFSDPVTLQVDGLPNDVTAEFQSNPVLPGATSELTIKTTRKTPLKRYTFTISGSTDSIAHKAKALLQVKSPKSVMSIQRSYSSDKTVLLVSRYKPSKDSVIANTYIMNTTGTWVKATASTEAGSVPLNKGEDYVILLGPYATKSLGNLTFHDGEFLSYTGERANFEALTVLAIDLFLRGTLGQEVPPSAFYDAFSNGQYAGTLLDDIFQALFQENQDCSDVAADLLNNLKSGHTTGFVEDFVKYISCMVSIKDKMKDLFVQILKDEALSGKAVEYLDSVGGGVSTFLDFLDILQHAEEFSYLMCPSLVPPIDGYFTSLGLCSTLGAPLDGWVRLDAVSQEQSKIKLMDSKHKVDINQSGFNGCKIPNKVNIIK